MSFPGKAKAFKAKLAYIRQDLTLKACDSRYNIKPQKPRFVTDLLRKRHLCDADITVTGLTKYFRGSCLTIVGFTNTILIFSDFKITFCTSL